MHALPIALVATGALAFAAAGAADAPTVLAKIRVAPATSPCAAAGGAGFVWVSEYSSPYLLKINPKTNKVVKKIGIGNGSCGLGFGAGSLWVEDTTSNTISRVSVATGKRTAAVMVGLQPYDSTFAYGADWATSYGNGELDRIDPGKNRVVKRFKLGSAVGVVGAFGSIWATGDQGVLRIDPATNTVLATIPVESAGWTAASSEAVWITTSSGIVRIDPSTNAIAATIKLASVTIGDPGVVGGHVWVPLIRENAIAVVDPATNAVTRTVKVGQGPFVVTQIAGEAWVPSWKGTDIWRLKP
jgi:YVTN family beta-propeller protein